METMSLSIREVHMSSISIKDRAESDALLDSYVEALARRVGATPPGTCPIAVQLSMLQVSASQTCGKCTPCSAGIPRMERLLEQVLEYEADSDTIEELRRHAQLLCSTADCVVGYNAGELVLQGLESFAAEYESHIGKGVCQQRTKQTVPCVTECPAHVNVPAYISLVQEGDCAGAIKMIRKDNPFPTACALVCEHPCEAHCRRSIIDAPLNIRGIKKYAVDTVAADKVEVPAAAQATGKRVAVIGGGPSGMTCAYYLALMGHAVEV
ncbi:MAG: NADH-ubiquinone oxidoreductase-F iron-sulfur binding region domain-containing protein, partial [Coriobacteriales bacterium]